MQDDYGIDLGAAAAEADDLQPIAHREAVEREIAELRNQINNIGAVNLDALDELDNLESRFGHLSQQYRDLVDAKASLERIIARIHTDSRQLFIATLEVVRGHFQELFRHLFGGGEANIVLEDEEDVLECGVEIVARPPGKEACNISLLSGGEKTLTCVALLLAVFHSKPSPFCVLDEVDAALDESNIGRFVGVLREFLSFTQFIVVSHSKKTMSGGRHAVRHHDAGVGRVEAGLGAIRRCQRRWAGAAERNLAARSDANHRRTPTTISRPRAARPDRRPALMLAPYPVERRRSACTAVELHPAAVSRKTNNDGLNGSFGPIGTSCRTGITRSVVRTIETF